MNALDRRDQRRGGTYPGIVTDRGQEGCNIVTVQGLVSARVRSQTPPPGLPHADRIAGP